MGHSQDNRVRSPAPDSDRRPHDVRPGPDRVGPSGAVGDRGDDRGIGVGGNCLAIVYTILKYTLFVVIILIVDCYYIGSVSTYDKSRTVL